jgi:hypothetical protein
MRQHPTNPSIFVADDGRVFRELFPSKDSGGYHQIRNGDLRQRRHVLVCEAFHGPRPFPRAEVRHLDGDPSNDAPGNLAWGTRVDNCADTAAHGRTSRGAKNHSTVLSEAQALEIKQRRLAGESGKALADEFGVSQGTVCDIKYGRSWDWLK